MAALSRLITERRGLIAGLAFAAAGLFGLGAWWMGWFGRAEDPRVTAIKNLQQELAAKYPPEKGPTSIIEAAERVAAISTVMTQINALPEELRPQALESGRRILMRSMQAKIDGYFALPPKERVAHLDREIKQMEFMRKAFETGQGLLSAVGLGGSAKPRPAGSPWMQPRSDADRETWRKQMLDSTSPEQRARFAEYFAALQQRRETLGLPSGPPR